MNNTDGADATSAELLSALLDHVPAEHIRTSTTDRDFYSTDVYSSGVRADCVVAPESVDALRAVVRACAALDHPVIARGGGLSYSGGYLPQHAGAVIIDLSRLTRIVEINEVDMYVTVETGCTWRDLYAVLKPRGLRTPYFGPMSGYLSTVGGALSQGSVFLGSTLYGTSAETALSLDVVLADGSLVSTGSASGAVRPSPFFRTYGPDLTGLFLGDCGVLGIKARATLQLMRIPPESRYLAYSYTTAEQLLGALAEISRSSLASECFGTDPYVQSRRIHEQNLAKDLGYLKAVAQNQSSVLAGIGAAARMAWKGRRSLGGEKYVMNVVVEDTTAAGADARAVAVRGISGKHGLEIEASVPRAIRSLPFTYPNDTLGDRGERWVPTQALVPHSRALEVVRALEEYFAARETDLETHGIEWGYIVFAVAARTTLIEPLFYWPDRRTVYHERMIQPQYLAKLPVLEPNPDASRVVRALRKGLVDLFAQLGCAHLQIGRTYPFLEHRQPAAKRLLQAIKDAVDPARVMNPGALGF